jgi:ribosomal protein S2
MFIDDNALRKELKNILLTKTRNQVVKEIKSKGKKMHQYTIDRFLSGALVSIKTLRTLDEYVYRHSKGFN